MREREREIRLIVLSCDPSSIQPLIASLKCHIEKQARVKCIFSPSPLAFTHIHKFTHWQSSFHTQSCMHTFTHSHKVPWVVVSAQMPPPPSPLFSLSLPWLVFRHAGSSTLGCTRSPPALPLPPSSLYISPVRHLHGNVERDLCPRRAMWRCGVFQVGGGV